MTFILHAKDQRRYKSKKEYIYNISRTPSNALQLNATLPLERKEKRSKPRSPSGQSVPHTSRKLKSSPPPLGKKWEGPKDTFYSLLLHPLYSFSFPRVGSPERGMRGVLYTGVRRRRHETIVVELVSDGPRLTPVK